MKGLLSGINPDERWVEGHVVEKQALRDRHAQSSPADEWRGQLVRDLSDRPGGWPVAACPGGQNSEN